MIEYITVRLVAAVAAVMIASPVLVTAHATLAHVAESLARVL